MSVPVRIRASVRRLTEALSAGFTEREILQCVADEALSLTNSVSVAVGILSPRSDVIDFVSASGSNARQVRGLRIRLSDSLSEEAVATCRPVILDRCACAETGDLFATADVQTSIYDLLINTNDQVDDISEDQIVGQSLDQDIETDAFSRASPNTGERLPVHAVVVPLVQSGRVFGTISALNRPTAWGANSGANAFGRAFGRAFGKDDIDTLEMLGQFVLLARRMDSSLESQWCERNHSAALSRFARSSARGGDRRTLAEIALDSLCAHVQKNAAVALLLDPSGSRLIPAAARGCEARESFICEASDVVRFVLDNGETRIVPDFEAALGSIDLALDSLSRSAIVAPICAVNVGEGLSGLFDRRLDEDAEVLGIIIVTSHQRDAFNDSDRRLASTIGEYLGIAIGRIPLEIPAVAQ